MFKQLLDWLSNLIGHDKLIPNFLAIVVTVGFVSLMGMMAFHAVPSESQRVLDVMTGSLGTAFIGIVNYHFGSSSGSAKKTEILAQTPTKGTS